MDVARNAPCPCGSGLKYKKCHGTTREAGARLEALAEAHDLGALFPFLRPRGVATGAPGNFLWALDVEAFLPRQEFLARMDAQIDQIKESERLPGVDELLVPGEGGQRRYPS